MMTLIDCIVTTEIVTKKRLILFGNRRKAVVKESTDSAFPIGRISARSEYPKSKNFFLRFHFPFL